MASPGNAANDETEVRKVLADYYRDFSTLNVQAISSYFHEPSLMIGAQGVVSALDNAAVAAAFTPATVALRARGYGRSELRLQSLTLLSSTAAVATGIATRFKLDGQELERVGLTYILHKTGDRWKIAVFIIHDISEA